MSDDLDLGSLTGDQLVALAQLVAVEIASRASDVQGAARAAILDEAERTAVAREAAEAEREVLREAERQRVREDAIDEARHEARIRSLLSDQERIRLTQEAREAELGRLRGEERARLRREAAVAAQREARTSPLLDEAERDRVSRLAADMERARLRDEERARVRQDATAAVERPVSSEGRAFWAISKTVGLMVRETLGPGWCCSVWQRDGDTRVYLDRADKADVRKVTLYCTGSERVPPGVMRCEGLSGPVDRDRLRAICAYAWSSWARRAHFECDEAVEADVVARPYPSDYVAATRSAA